MKNENMKRQVLKSILLLMLLNAVPGWAQQQDLADFKETERPRPERYGRTIEANRRYRSRRVHT